MNNTPQRIASSEKNLLEAKTYFLTSLHLPRKTSKALHELVLEMARHSNMKSDVVMCDSHPSEGFGTLQSEAQL